MVWNKQYCIDPRYRLRGEGVVIKFIFPTCPLVGPSTDANEFDALKYRCTKWTFSHPSIAWINHSSRIFEYRVRSRWRYVVALNHVQKIVQVTWSRMREGGGGWKMALGLCKKWDTRVLWRRAGSDRTGNKPSDTRSMLGSPVTGLAFN